MYRDNKDKKINVTVIDMLVDFMRYFTTHFPIHCHIHQRETKLKFVGKKEDTAHRVGEREREREGEGGKQRNCKENKRRKRESLCELAHNGNAKVSSLPGRKSTVGHLGNRMCILNVSQGLYVRIVYDILLAFLFPSSFRYPSLSRRPLISSFYLPSFSATPTRHYHHRVLTRRECRAERGRRTGRRRRQRRRSGKLHSKQRCRAHIGYVCSRCYVFTTNNIKASAENIIKAFR